MYSLDIDTTAAHQEFATTLDPNAPDTYILRTMWNERDSCFYLDLYDSGRVPIWLGQRIVVGWRMWNQCVDPRKPPGELMALDSSNKDLDATLTVNSDGTIVSELGGRVRLIYFTASELVSVGG